MRALGLGPACQDADVADVERLAGEPVPGGELVDSLGLSALVLP